MTIAQIDLIILIYPINLKNFQCQNIQCANLEIGDWDFFRIIRTIRLIRIIYLSYPIQTSPPNP